MKSESSRVRGHGGLLMAGRFNLKAHKHKGMLNPQGPLQFPKGCINNFPSQLSSVSKRLSEPPLTPCNLPTTLVNSCNVVKNYSINTFIKIFA